MKVYIIRHGETLYNALNQYSDEKVDLNEQGILQANELREKLKEKIIIVYWSLPTVVYQKHLMVILKD